MQKNMYRKAIMFTRAEAVPVENDDALGLDIRWDVAATYPGCWSWAIDNLATCQALPFVDGSRQLNLFCHAADLFVDESSCHQLAPDHACI